MPFIPFITPLNLKVALVSINALFLMHFNFNILNCAPESTNKLFVSLFEYLIRTFIMISSSFVLIGHDKNFSFERTAHLGGVWRESFILHDSTRPVYRASTRFPVQ